jgi:hypothetical protein
MKLGGWVGWGKFAKILDVAKDDRNRKLPLTMLKLGGRNN